MNIFENARIQRPRAGAVRQRRAHRPARDHRHPLHRARPRRRRLPHVALRHHGRSDHRRAAPLARHELQERDGRSAVRRRQGRDHRRLAPQDARSCSRPSAASSIRSAAATSPPKMSAPPPRTWKTSRKQTSFVTGLHRRGRRVRRRPVAEDRARRVPRHQGRSEIPLGRSDLDGLRVAVQGVGGVGYHLCRLLAADGAKLRVADVRATAAERVRDELGAAAVPVETVLV